jgi:hypothetical protein
MVSEVSEIFALVFPDLLSAMKFFVLHFAHSADLHSSLVEHSGFREIHYVESDLSSFFNICNRKVEPLGVASSISVDAHDEVEFVSGDYFS